MQDFTPKGRETEVYGEGSLRALRLCPLIACTCVCACKHEDRGGISCENTEGVVKDMIT